MPEPPDSSAPLRSMQQGPLGCRPSHHTRTWQRGSPEALSLLSRAMLKRLPRGSWAVDPSLSESSPASPQMPCSGKTVQTRGTCSGGAGEHAAEEVRVSEESNVGFRDIVLQVWCPRPALQGEMFQNYDLLDIQSLQSPNAWKHKLHKLKPAAPRHQELTSCRRTSWCMPALGSNCWDYQG